MSAWYPIRLMINRQVPVAQTQRLLNPGSDGSFVILARAVLSTPQSQNSLAAYSGNPVTQPWRVPALQLVRGWAENDCGPAPFPRRYEIL